MRKFLFFCPFLHFLFFKLINNDKKSTAEAILMEEITTEEQKKYWEIFISLNPKNGYLSGDQAADVLKNSKLSNYQLEKIWNLAGIVDGNLDFEEFCIAMRLIFDVINNVYVEVPAELPDFLIPTSKAHLITARQAINENVQRQQFMKIPNKTRALRYDFDWHIQPSDKQNYETIYTSTADSYGYISFDTLKNLYAILDISDTELRDACDNTQQEAGEPPAS
ncbi:hypothetical protein PMAC_000173 [Pneumocystis sp. 'macacae']|nr:hypothetical protein PMAC_000173 [Pneumocystis sp. 'macacae']